VPFINTDLPRFGLHQDVLAAKATDDTYLTAADASPACYGTIFEISGRIEERYSHSSPSVYCRRCCISMRFTTCVGMNSLGGSSSVAPGREDWYR